MQQARHRLCCEIIKQHFGQTAKRIFKTLLNGRQTLDELLKHNVQNDDDDNSDIDNNDNNNDKARLIQKSLKTLIEHNAVQYYEEEKEKMIKKKKSKIKIIYYFADIDSVEMRLHFPHFISIIKQYSSDSFNLEFADLMMEHLCEYGECTKQQLFDLWAHSVYKILDKIESNNNNLLQLNMNNYGKWTHSISSKSKEEKKKEIRKHFMFIFKWLLNDKCFIVFTAKKELKDNGPALKLRKLSDESKHRIDSEAKYIICHRSLLHEMRRNLIEDFMIKKYDSTFCLIVSTVFEHSLFELRSSYQSTLNPLWRNETEKDEMREAFRESVLERVNASPIENRYSIGKQLNNDEKEQYSLPFTISIHDINYKLNHLNEALLNQYISILSEGHMLLNEIADILPILLPSNIVNNEEYSVNIEGIIHYIQMLDVQKLVHSRFDSLQIEDNDNNNIDQSNEASVLFGAIISMRKIGDKQLSELCMMKHSTVKKVLYRMLNDKFIEMEYIPRSADRDPKKSMFLWSINWRNLHKKILESMYSAEYNLITKKLKIRKMIEKIENDNSQKINKQQNVKWKKLCAAFQHLTIAIHKIDAQIALHRDF